MKPLQETGGSLGAGMTEMEFENAVSRALVSNRAVLPNLPIDKLCGMLAEVKTEVVKRSEVLELMKPVDIADVGGLDDLKEWLVKRLPAFSKEARDAGVDMPKGCALFGPPGCVAAGTIINYRRGKRNSFRCLSVEVMHDKYNNVGCHPGAPWKPGEVTYVQSWDASTGRVFYNAVQRISDKGMKSCVRILAGSAGEVVLTEDHPVLLSDGRFVPAGEIQVGQCLLVRGDMKPSSQNVARTRRHRIVVEGLKFYGSGWRHSVYDHVIDKSYNYQRQHRARLVLEAHINEMGYEDFIHALKYDPALSASFIYLPRDVDVHHLDENPLNDDLANLLDLPRNDHKLHHGQISQENFHVEYTRQAEVRSVEDAGVHGTFDLSMADPCANFAVNGGLFVEASACRGQVLRIAAKTPAPRRHNSEILRGKIS